MPATGGAREDAAEAHEERPTFDLGDGIAAQHVGDESWDVIGQRLRMHLSFWQLQEDGYSPCTVVGYIGQFEFPAGPVSRHTYVVEHEGHHYAARHNAVAGALIDPAARRRAKQGAPKLLKQ